MVLLRHKKHTEDEEHGKNSIKERVKKGKNQGIDFPSPLHGDIRVFRYEGRNVVVKNI